MVRSISKKIISSLLILLFTFSGSIAPIATKSAEASGPTHGKRVIGYYPEWGVYGRDYYPADIPAAKYTHIIHSFLNIVPDTANPGKFKCVIGDTYAAGTNDPAMQPWEAKVDPDNPGWGSGVINQLKYLRNSSGRNNNLKLMFSVGGATWSSNFPAASSTAAQRQHFAASCISIMRTATYDGLDLDWEFPSSATEGNNYALLMQEFRAQLDAKETQDGKQYELSAAVMVNPDTHPTYLPLATVGATLDWVGLMNYDYNGAWGAPWKTNHNAPLYRSSEFPNDNFTVKDTIDAYHANGAIPYSKLVMGYGFYGRGWAGVSSGTNGGLFQNGTGPVPGHALPIGSNEDGIADYEYIKSLIGTGDWQYTFDEEQKVPYLYSPSLDRFYSYDDANSAKAKVSLLKSLGMGGVMVWDLSNEDNVNGVGNTLSSAIDAELSASAKTITKSGSITESLANDGSTTGSSVTYTVAGDTYTGAISNGSVFTSGVHYTTTGLPSGMTAVLTKTSNTVATLTLSGNASSHAAANSTSMLVNFTDAAFSVSKITDFAPIQSPNIPVYFNDPPISITYSPLVFDESTVNNGSISTVITANLANTGGTYSPTLTAGTHVIFSNVPSGLTGAVSRLGNNTAQLSLSGSATNHANANDISNLTVAFQNSAFSTNNAAGVVDSTKQLSVNFLDPASIVWSGNFIESSSNNGAVTGSRTATLSGATFADIGTTMTNSIDYTIANVPAGLSAMISVNSLGTIATLQLTGLATAHAVANNSANLTVQFLNSAFAGGVQASLVSGSTNSTGSVTFIEKQISYSRTTFGEADANNGSISDTVSATLVGDTYVSGLAAGTHVLFTNVPLGLTGVVTRTSSTVATLSLSGSATNHANAHDVSNLTVAFQNGAFTGGSAVAITNATRIFSVDFDDAAVITWSGNFTESVSNNGSVTGSRVAALVGDTFAGPAVGSVFALTTHYTTANIPSGLTAVVTKTSNTVATVTLTGSATVHGVAQNISNLTITFQNGAFTNNLTASTVVGYFDNTGTISFVDAGVLTYNTGTFTESAGNTGSIAHSITVTLTGDTFVGALTAGGNVIFSNFPAGLTGVVVRDTPTQASLTVSGTAISHANANDIANAGIQFTNAAFTSNNAAAVQNSTRNDISFDFTDGASLSWTGDFVESSSNNGAVTGSRTATLTGDTFASSIGATFIPGTHYVLANVPAGLTAQLAKTSDTVATLTFSSITYASNHSAANSTSNLTVTFLNGAFTNTAIASNATGHSNSSGVITFNDVSVVWSGNFTESSSNNGTLTGSRTATITGATFAGPYIGSAFTPGVHFNVPNIPSGLTAVLTKTSSTIAALTMSGSATAHGSVNNVSGLSIALLDAAFPNSMLATNVIGSTNSAGTITYIDIASQGVSLWLRADADVYSDSGVTRATQGQQVERWNDVAHSEIFASQATANRRGVLQINSLNSNPVIVFDNDVSGQEDYYSLPTTHLPQGNSARTYLFVAEPADTDPGNLDTSFFTHGLKESNPGGKVMSFSLYQNNTAVGVGGHKYGVASGQSSYGIYRWQMEQAAQSDALSLAVNGFSTVTSTLNGSARAINTTTDEAFLGRNPSTATLQSFDGGIAEVIVLDSNLSATDIRKWESYLAIKYGLTLDQSQSTTNSGAGDYVSNNGAVVWDAHSGTAQNPYRYDIAGIGRDDNRQLLQTQSRSSQSTWITRLSDATNLSNDEYLVAGHNNGSLAWTTTDAPAGYQVAGRSWEMRETGSIGNVDIEINTENPNANIPALLGGTKYYLIIDADDDGLFSDETPVEMKDDGTLGDDTPLDSRWTRSINPLDTNVTTLFTIATEYTAPSMSYTGGSFVESASNTGEITGTLGISLSGDTFNSSVANGSNFVASTHYTTANVPAGLSVTLAKNTTTTATLSFAGNATSHSSANNVSNISLSFLNAAFTSYPANSIANATKSDISIAFSDTATITWTGSFTESASNNGAVTGSRSATLTGDTYAGPAVGLPFVAMTHYTVSNTPVGLTAVLTKTSNTVATLSFTGAATNHSAIDSVANLTVTFLNGALTSNSSVSTVAGYTDSQGVVTFSDAKQIVWSGSFTESSANNGSVTGSRVATLTGDTYAGPSVGSPFIDSTHYTTANIPAGLTSVFTKTSPTVATMTLAGSASDHATVDSVANLTVTFVNGVFTNTPNASDVAGRINTGGVVTFFDDKLVSWSGDFTEAISNDGTMVSTNNRQATLSGAQFSSSIPKGGTFIEGTHYTVSNIPAGMSALMTKKSNNIASFRLVGRATLHSTAQNVGNLTIAFTDAAFSGGSTADISGFSNNTGTVTFFNSPMLTWSGTFTETASNTGVIAGSRVGVVSGDTIRPVVADGGVVPTRYYTTTNVPRGLSLVLTKTNNTTLTATLSGAALLHDSANSINNMSLTLRSRLFTNTVSPSDIINYSDTAIPVTFSGSAAITFSGNTFAESSVNDGTVQGVMDITLSGDTFASSVSTGDTFTASTHYSVVGVPVGLTARVEKVSSTLARLSFTGSASSHANSSDIATISISFSDTAFQNVSTTSVNNSTISGIAINFADPAQVVYSGSFSESIPNNGAVTGSIVATITGDTFNQSVSVGGLFVSGTHYTTANIPAGLSAVVTKTSDTSITLTLSGNAVNHAPADNVSTISLTLLTPAFTSSSASNIVGTSFTSGVLTFTSNGVPGFVITPTDGTTVVAESGTTDTFGVVLAVAPATDVVLSVTASDTGEATVSPSMITFTNANWSTPQVVTVTGVDDSLVDGSQNSGVFVSVVDASSDNSYDSVSDQGVLVVTTDNDVAPSNTIIWSGNFAESSLNNGTISSGSTRRATLLGDTFVASLSKGAEFVPGTHVTTANVPVGLTVRVYKMSPTVATVRLTGVATSHAVANSANMTVSFMNAAFTGNNASAITGSSDNSGSVSFIDPAMIVWAGSFTESVANDGTVTGGRTATLSGDSFAPGVTIGGLLTLGSHYTTANIPVGLTVVATKTSNSIVTFTLTGSASNHTALQNVSNLTITFMPRVFQNSIGSASSVTGYTDALGQITFSD